MSIKLIFGSLLLFIPFVSYAVEYDCQVEQKFTPEGIYTAEEIKKGQFSVRVEEGLEGAFLSRCSYANSVGKVTCDRYKVDKVATDKYVKIKKFYVFKSHFDVQLFLNMEFVENNGRGGISFGKCKVKAP